MGGREGGRKGGGEDKKRSRNSKCMQTPTPPLTPLFLPPAPPYLLLHPMLVLLLLLPEQSGLGRDGTTSVRGQTVGEGEIKEGGRKRGEVRYMSKRNDELDKNGGDDSYSPTHAKRLLHTPLFTRPSPSPSLPSLPSLPLSLMHSPLLRLVLWWLWWSLLLLVVVLVGGGRLVVAAGGRHVPARRVAC